MKKPFTPLPWTVEPDPMFGAKVLGPKQNGVKVILSNSGDNADYIAHSANAYPKLVKALRFLADNTAPSKPGEARRKAAALLRELGEKS